MPLITVIVPNYNHKAYLQQRLDSIFNQTLKDFEVIILDDCSTDNSRDIIETFRHHPQVNQIIYNTENSGSPFKQWEKGISLAKGKYIWIAESDDVAEPELLMTAWNVLKSDATISLAYVQSEDIDHKGNRVESRSVWTEELSPNLWKQDFVMDGNHFISTYLIYKNVIPNTSAVLFSREVFARRYDPTILAMKMLGDWYTWVSLLMDHKIGFICQPLNRFRTHDATTRNHLTKVRKRQRILEQMQVLQKVKNCNTVTSPQWKIARRSILLRWANQFSIAEAFNEPSFYKPLKLCSGSKTELVIHLLHCTLSKIIRPVKDDDVASN